MGDDKQRREFPTGKRRPSGSGEAKAEELYRRAFAIALVLALEAFDAHMAQQVAHDIAVGLWWRLRDHPTKYPEPEKLKSYIARAVWQRAVSFHNESRRHRRGNRRYEAGRESVQREWMDPAAAFDLRQTEESLGRDMLTLTQTDRKVALRVLQDGYSHAEVAQELGMEEGTSRVHLSTALSTLKRARRARGEESQ
jgi:RNA polymerase sigma factor (sigma-70 family)